MTRSLPSAVVARIGDGEQYLATLYEADFDTGDVRLWSGLGDLTIGDETYLGVGDLLKISTIAESQELRSNGVTVELSGIPSDLIAEALAEPVSSRIVRMKLVRFEADGTVIGEPVPLFVGRADIPTLSDDGRTATYRLSCESRLVDMGRARDSRLTDQDQQQRFPGDRGLEHVPAIQEREITWGKT